MTEFGDQPLLNTGPLSEPPEGFPFTSESPLRRLTEPAAFFQVPTIATRAIMHDGIAAAVRVHSRLFEHPWGRYLDTSSKGLTLTLDDLPAALDAARSIFEMHKDMRGEYQGVKYDANDVHAQTWVLDCAHHGIVEAGRRWGPGLDEDQQSAIWRDVFSFGRFFGIPSNVMPNTFADLKAYREDKREGNDLLQTQVSSELAQEIFNFHSWKAPLPVARIGQAVIKGSIEPVLLERAGVTTTDFDNRVNVVLDWAVQQSYGRLPKEIRERAIPFVLEGRHKLKRGIGSLATARQGLKLKIAA